MARPSAVRRLASATAPALAVVVLLTGCSSEEPVAVPTTTTVPPLEAPMVDSAAGSADAGVSGKGTGSEVPKADMATRRLAKAAVLKHADFAAGWSIHTKGSVRELDPSSCSYREGGSEAALRTGAARRGASMQLGDEPAFVTSSSFVFADEASAIEWMAVARSDDWAECTAEALAREGERRGSLADVRLETRTIERLGSKGFEAYAEFHGSDDADRTVVVISVMHYRMGRVVLEETLERSTGLNDANWAAVDSAHSTALATAWSRLNAARPGATATPVAAR